MKTTALFLAFSTLLLQAGAEDFSRASKFASVAAFVAAAKTFLPATTKSDLASIFTVRELGQREDPKTGTPVVATAIQSSDSLWANNAYAIVFVSATPPTEATRSSVGVLFLLVQGNGQWRISDFLRFTATGKEAEISAELTAGTGTGYHLGNEGMAPVVTVKESQGGRGYAYQAYASYSLNGSKLKRLELK
jgi:hypothetical protein